MFTCACFEKAVLFERGLALAVAMRTFRVGAIALPPPPLLPGLPSPPPPGAAADATADASAAGELGTAGELGAADTLTAVARSPEGGSAAVEQGGEGGVIAASTASTAVAAVAAAAANAARRVTIETALQFAVREQASGKHLVAEAVYRDILAAHPSHAEALHLLGLAHYQRGSIGVCFELAYLCSFYLYWGLACYQRGLAILFFFEKIILSIIITK